MIKVMRCKCVSSVKVRKNGAFTSRVNYWGRVSKDGSVMMLSDEGQWIKVFEPKMNTAYQPIIDFVLIYDRFAKNKKELKELIKN
ncbi:TPA: hypothetical protein ROX91_002016 [Bacillus cereus]|nr:hypothetical protein [Bacillus cereus]